MTDQFIENFLFNHKTGIETIFNIKGKIVYETLDLFISALSFKLNEEYTNLISKSLSLEEINAQLFYSVNDFVKVKPDINNEVKKYYLCPGCSYLGLSSILEDNKYLKCKICQDKLKLANNPKDIAFYKTFAYHNLSGYKCTDCNRFIPKSDDVNISCPYFDCCFVGNANNLKRMRHPALKGDVSSISNLEIKNDNIESTIHKHIKETIQFQLNNLVYTNFNFTVKHKVLVYQAFLDLLDQFPSEMADYLLHQSRSGGFQHKIFQKYISLLEESFPFVIKKNKKVIRISSLLDENLALFDGISIFENLTNKNSIKNNTQEYYIGGRAASKVSPYYIGKLLNVIHRDTKESLMDNVTEYSFSKIKLRDIENNTPVIVTHLRIPPHYQMGGMVYVNRIRKKIVDALKK